MKATDGDVVLVERPGFSPIFVDSRALLGIDPICTGRVLATKTNVGIKGFASILAVPFLAITQIVIIASKTSTLNMAHISDAVRSDVVGKQNGCR